MLKKEWPVDEKGERIYQITNIYEEKAEELPHCRTVYRHPPGNGVPCGHFTAVSLRGAGRMETQRNADDGISAESVNEKQNREDREKKNCPPCFCCGGDTGKSGSIRPLLIADADQIIQTDLIQLRQTDGNGDRQLPDAFSYRVYIAVAAEIVGNLADRQIAVRAQILQSLIFHDSSPLRKCY